MKSNIYSPINKTLGKFTWRQTRNSTIVWSLILGIYSLSKIVGYAAAYPSLASRIQFANLMSKSSGLDILIGPDYRLQTISGYIIWAIYMIVILGGSIWAILTVTKRLRGDEEAGRFDMVLSNEVDLKKLTRSLLSGIFKSTLLLFIISSLIIVGIGRYKGVGLAPQHMLFLSFSICLAISLFVLVAALMSQLVSTRRQAMSASMIVLTVFLAIKGIADISSIKWLLDISPLGWFERLKPLEGSHLIWLIPILILSMSLYALTIHLSGIRELNQSWINKRSNYKPRLGLLGNLTFASFRFDRGLIYIWLTILVYLNLLYGLLTKLAVGAIGGSPDYLKTVKHISSGASVGAGTAYVGAIFFLDMILLSVFAANCLNSLRHDELSGHDFNVLVNPIGRIRYLFNKLSVQISGLIAAALISSIGFWLGEIISSDRVVSLSSLVLASLNALIPAALIIGIGIVAYGRVPRISNLIVWATIMLSVVLNLLSGTIKINRYINDLSVFNHIKLAPASSPDWRSNLSILVVSILLVATGIYRYNRRDLIND